MSSDFPLHSAPVGGDTSAPIDENEEEPEYTDPPVREPVYTPESDAYPFASLPEIKDVAVFAEILDFEAGELSLTNDETTENDSGCTCELGIHTQVPSDTLLAATPAVAHVSYHTAFVHPPRQFKRQLPKFKRFARDGEIAPILTGGYNSRANPVERWHATLHPAMTMLSSKFGAD